MNARTRILVLAGLAASVVLAAACSNGSDGMMQNGQGRVNFVISSSAPTSAPSTSTTMSTTTASLIDPNSGTMLKAANVTFASIVARNLEGELIDVTIDLPVTVDLLSIAGSGSLTLPVGFLPPGTYDQLVIVMTKVELTTQSDTIITIDPPGGGWTAILAVQNPFDVVEGQTTTVDLKFRLERLFEWLEDHWEFHPEFECDGDED